MYMTLCITGINLERLLRKAADAGIVVSDAVRTGERNMHVRVRADQASQMIALCRDGGWGCGIVRPGLMHRLRRFVKARPAFLPAMVFAALLVFFSSKMILYIRVDGAGESAAQVRAVLREERICAGRPKTSIRLQELRSLLSHRLPGLAHVSVSYAGSMLIVDCMPAVEGENLALPGGEDIVAASSGIVRRIWASAGTPLVLPGQAVHKGQVLIAGYERAQQGTKIPVKAQGQVTACVYVQGEAKTSLRQTRSVETGQSRRRVILKTPWTQRVVRDAQPFACQDVSRRAQTVVGLYLPLWREIETYAQTEQFEEDRSRSDAASIAQGAAEKIARKQCPPDALILDKWVNYSMIDNEFVYASVVLEIEAPIAGRLH